MRYPCCGWVGRIFGRNPLLRRTDRVEALAVVLATIASVLAIPVACAVGTAVYMSRERLYADEIQTRHAATATVMDVDSPRVRPYAGTITVRAKWRDGGADHTDSFKGGYPVKRGETMQIWVDNHGNHVNPPAPTSQAGVDAVNTGLQIWLGVSLVATALAAATRAPLNRKRDAEWDRELRSLADDGGGRTNRRQ
jgi:hypothetical protein